ncbi:diphosphomevalonate decarboxylase [Halobacteriales archaeon QH_10_70_21]|nr:MAG: diphosphomevalonate decarboxylase [Halobacteriales archaeon QH_10_70_21]
MKATAKAHPIQGLVKYHGMHDEELRLPYHDSISVCTAPSHSKTTVEFDPSFDADRYVVDGEVVEGRGAERIRSVVDRVRELAGVEHRVRFESINDFPTNIGFGSSASGFAAAAVALCAAADLELSHPEMSAIARRGSASAARAVTGAFSHLPEVPAFKHTAEAHREAADSHMFDARMAHIHEQIRTVRHSLRNADFETTFETAEHDSLSLAAATMTGPSGWVYWQPETLEVFETVRDLREAGVPVYFSTDTGASVYVNTTDEHVDRVEGAIADLGVDTHVWDVGGPATVLDDDEALF